jgi:Protein of unknown function (DUF3800)
MPISRVSFYGDESGSHGEGIFVLSGYLGSDDVWSGLETQWHGVLHDSAIGGHEIEYFHMRECFRLEGEFAPFNRWQAKRKLDALVDVLCPLLRSKKLREFTSTIDWEVYNRAVTGPTRDAFHNPYLLTFGAVMAETAKCMRDVIKQEEPIFFFLDDQIARIEGDAARQFRRAKVTLSHELAGLFDEIAFRSDKYYYPLQAADLIAWQRHREALNLAEDLGGRREFRRLRNSTKSALLMPYREDGLIDFICRAERKLKDCCDEAGWPT